METIKNRLRLKALNILLGKTLPGSKTTRPKWKIKKQKLNFLKNTIMLKILYFSLLFHFEDKVDYFVTL